MESVHLDQYTNGPCIQYLIFYLISGQEKKTQQYLNSFFFWMNYCTLKSGLGFLKSICRYGSTRGLFCMYEHKLASLAAGNRNPCRIFFFHCNGLKGALSYHNTRFKKQQKSHFLPDSVWSVSSVTSQFVA